MLPANNHYSCNIIEMRIEYGCGLVGGELEYELARVQMSEGKFLIRHSVATSKQHIYKIENI